MIRERDGGSKQWELLSDRLAAIGIRTALYQKGRSVEFRDPVSSIRWRIGIYHEPDTSSSDRHFILEPIRGKGLRDCDKRKAAVEYATRSIRECDIRPFAGIGSRAEGAVPSPQPPSEDNWNHPRQIARRARYGAGLQQMDPEHEAKKRRQRFLETD